MRRLPGLLLWLTALCAASPSLAQTPLNFAGKSVSMVIGFPAGGGTDIAGRVIAANLGRHLPGNPSFVVENVPGAEGITAMNYFYQQAKPDGLSISMGSGSLGDPVHYRKPQAKYDPTKLNFIAGSGRGGSILIINRDAESRLYDKTKPPVIMGSTTGIPRSGMLMTTWGIEFLDWNAKWVIGYPGTSNLMLALERGEIEMTSSSNISLLKKLIATGRFKALAQSGSLESGHMVARAELGDTPVFEDLMKGKIKDSLQQKSFVYWQVLNDLDKWLALPPGSPQPVVDAYRAAYTEMLKDPAFLENAGKISDDFEPRAGKDVQQMIATLDAVTPEAISFIDAMLRRQGLSTE